MKDIRNLSKEEQIKIIREKGLKNSFNLSECDLSDCDLRNCDLSDCDLRDCNLSGSDLNGSDLSGVKIDENTIFSKIIIDKSQLEAINNKMFFICNEGEK